MPFMKSSRHVHGPQKWILGFDPVDLDGYPLGKSSKQKFNCKSLRIRWLCETAVENVRFEVRKRSNLTQVGGTELKVSGANLKVGGAIAPPTV